MGFINEYVLIKARMFFTVVLLYINYYIYYSQSRHLAIDKQKTLKLVHCVGQGFIISPSVLLIFFFITLLVEFDARMILYRFSIKLHENHPRHNHPWELSLSLIYMRPRLSLFFLSFFYFLYVYISKVEVADVPDVINVSLTLFYFFFCKIE